VVQRGEALYAQEIRAHVEPTHNGQFVVLDVESGDYEVDANKLAALDRLLARQPEAVPYIVRAGHLTAVTLGIPVASTGDDHRSSTLRREK
jgi:hypothetical protein